MYVPGIYALVELGAVICVSEETCFGAFCIIIRTEDAVVVTLGQTIGLTRRQGYGEVDVDVGRQGIGEWEEREEGEEGEEDSSAAKSHGALRQGFSSSWGLLQGLENDQESETGGNEQVFVETRIPTPLSIMADFCISVRSFLREKLGIRQSSQNFGACVGS